MQAIGRGRITRSECSNDGKCEASTSRRLRRRRAVMYSTAHACLPREQGAVTVLLDVTSPAALLDGQGVSRAAVVRPRTFIRKRHSYTVEYWQPETIEPRSRHILMRPFDAVESPKIGWINGWGATMSMIKPLGSAKISNSTEAEVEGNIRELVRDNATFRQAENSDGEIATSSLTTLLGRVSGNSTYEVDNLIGELQILRKRLQADGNRIRRDIEQYAALSQSVMQLTKIVSDSMKKLPDASGVSG
jgi:hypothetical protein